MVLQPQITLLVIYITIIVNMTSTIITTYPIIDSLPWHCHHPHQDHHRQHHHQGRADSKDGRRQHWLCDLHRGRSCTWCLASGYSQDQTIIILTSIFLIIIIWSPYSWWSSHSWWWFRQRRRTWSINCLFWTPLPLWCLRWWLWFTKIIERYSAAMFYWNIAFLSSSHYIHYMTKGLNFNSTLLHYISLWFWLWSPQKSKYQLTN